VHERLPPTPIPLHLTLEGSMSNLQTAIDGWQQIPSDPPKRQQSLSDFVRVRNEEETIV
jgi:hypothetical protein